MSKHDHVANAPAAEALGTVALFLNVIALIAFAVCLGTFTLEQSLAAAATGVVAVVAFAVSLVCFAVDSGRFEQQRA